MSLETLQTEAFDRLSKCAALLKADCAVIEDNKGDIDAAIHSELSKLGLCAVVLEDGADNAGETGGANPTLKAALTVMVYETPQANRRKANHLTVAAAARAVAAELHVLPPLPSGHAVLKRITGTMQDPAVKGIVFRAVTFEILTQLKGSGQ